MQKDRRKSPRLKVGPPIPCFFTVDTINGVPAKVDKPAQGEVLDISENGLRFASDLSLPVELNIEVTLNFTLRGAPFQRKARLVHRQEGLPPTYGVAFFHTGDNIAEDMRLHRVLAILKAQQNSGTSRQ